MRYRKKPTEVEARQVDAMDYDDMTDLLGWCGGHAVDYADYVIVLSRDEDYVRPGDWIVKDSDGEFWVYAPEDFAASFEKVTLDA